VRITCRIDDRLATSGRRASRPRGGSPLAPPRRMMRCAASHPAHAERFACRSSVCGTCAAEPRTHSPVAARHSRRRAAWCGARLAIILTRAPRIPTKAT
ncbi:MAG: hypothetical protein ACI4QT_10650, partial [Kiritimatiellia bacterium]